MKDKTKKQKTKQKQKTTTTKNKIKVPAGLLRGLSGRKKPIKTIICRNTLKSFRDIAYLNEDIDKYNQTSTGFQQGVEQLDCSRNMIDVMDESLRFIEKIKTRKNAIVKKKKKKKKKACL